MTTAQEATAESLELSAGEEGIYLIKDDEVVIGMTGYFFYSSDVSEVGLRWHGVIPSRRGAGASTEALRQLIAIIRREQPQAEWLMELVPLTAYGEPIARYFSRLGFRPSGAPETYDWSDNAWQQYVLHLPSTPLLRPCE